MTENNIIVTDRGIYTVKCPRSEEYKKVLNCKTCGAFVKIDPVKKIIKCRG